MEINAVPETFSQKLTIEELAKAGAASLHSLVEWKLSELRCKMDDHIADHGLDAENLQYLFWHEKYPAAIVFYGAIIPKELDARITPLLKGFGFAAIPAEGKSWADVFGFEVG